jgi:hypothetical protein
LKRFGASPLSGQKSPFTQTKNRPAQNDHLFGSAVVLCGPTFFALTPSHLPGNQTKTCSAPDETISRIVSLPVPILRAVLSFPAENRKSQMKPQDRTHLGLFSRRSLPAKLPRLCIPTTL